MFLSTHGPQLEPVPFARGKMGNSMRQRGWAGMSAVKFIFGKVSGQEGASLPWTKSLNPLIAFA